MTGGNMVEDKHGWWRWGDGDCNGDGGDGGVTDKIMTRDPTSIVNIS